jgi:dUTP pyrophosphatase
MKIKIKLLTATAQVPRKATEGAAAYDVYVPTDVVIRPYRREIVPLGFSVELPKGYCAYIDPRSGYSAKGMEGADERRHDADVIHGLIDADYRGEVGVIIRNNGLGFTLKQGTRIAQMLIRKVEPTDFELTDSLSDTDRGTGGFGHTNKTKNKQK